MKRDLHKTKGRTYPSFRYTKKRSARKDRFQRRRKPGNPQYLRKRKTLDAQTIEKLVQDAILYIPIEAVPETAQKRKRLMRRPKNYSHLKKRKPGNPNLKRPARHLSSSVINNMISFAITKIMADPEIPTVTVPEEKPVQPLSSSLIDTMVSEAITEIVSEPEIPSVTEPAEKLPGKRPYYLLLIPLVAIIAFVFLYHSPVSQPSFVKEKRFAKTWRTELGLTYQSAGEDTEDLDDIIMDYLKDNDIDPSSLSYVVENLETSERYSLNPDTDRFAGSTYKLPLAMIWLDKVAEGEITLSDSLWYAKYYFEDGSYDFEHIDGDIYVSLQMVIKSVLRNSDNTAGHILFENLGGWSSFRELQKKYSDMPAVSDSLRPQNYMKASYMIDVAKYFYAHPERYQFAYDLLYDAAWWQYLNSVYHLGTIQKIGVYGSARNGVGFTPGEHPYAIAVYTSLGDYGETVMGEINALCYEYFYQVDEPGQKNYLDYGFTY